MKFNAIAKALEKDPSTISKEVIRSMDIKPIPHYKGNDYKFFDTCFESKLCASCCAELCKFCNLDLVFVIIGKRLKNLIIDKNSL